MRWACLLAVLIVFAQARGVGDRMNTYLENLAKAGRFSGVVLVAKGETVLLRQAYGFADVEKRVRFTPETPHRVASISKMITAMAVLRLRDAGRLRLTDSVCLHLSDCPKEWQPITVKQLMRHTSGIADYEEALGFASQTYLDFMTQPDATERIVMDAKQKPLEFKPGSGFKYSNTAYIVLSLIVQQASGQPFNDFVREAVLEPAGLTHSGMFSANTAPANLSVGYTVRNKVRVRIPMLALGPPAGDAALVSTLDDLLRWSLHMDRDAHAKEVFAPGLGGYGFGWFVDSRFDRTRYVHTGELPGHRAVFIKYPRDRITIIIFANNDQNPTEQMARDLAGFLF